MKFKEVLSVITAMLECLVFSGVIMGWPNLQQVLQQTGSFARLCQNSTTTALYDVTERNRSNVGRSCLKREETFNLIFTLSVSALSMSSLPLGYLLDRYGSRVFRCVACFLCTSSLVTMAVLTEDTSWMIFPSMIFLSVGGLALFVSNFQLSKLLKSLHSVYVTILNGMYDASALIFLILRIAHGGGFGVGPFFGILAAASLLPWLRTFLLMPKNLKENDESHVTTDRKYRMRERTLRSCLRSKTFWTNVIHFSLNSLKMSFFVGSLVSWVTGLASATARDKYVEIFGAMLMGGAIVSPLNGIMTDAVTKYYQTRIRNIRKSRKRGLFVSATFTSFLGISLSVSALNQQILTSFVLLVIFRSFSAGFNATFVSLSFPQKHFGKLYGLTQTVAGLVGLLQYLLFKLTLEFDPEFYVIRIVMILLGILTLVHPVCLYREGFFSGESSKSEKTRPSK